MMTQWKHHTTQVGVWGVAAFSACQTQCTIDGQYPIHIMTIMVMVNHLTDFFVFESRTLLYVYVVTRTFHKKNASSPHREICPRKRKFFLCGLTLDIWYTLTVREGLPPP